MKIVHAFGTAGTGGFGIKNTSIGTYSSPAIDMVIAVFQNSPVCLYAYGQTWNIPDARIFNSEAARTCRSEGINYRVKKRHFANKKRTPSAIVRKIYIKYRISEERWIFGVSLPASGLGISARIMCIEYSFDIGITAIINTSIPIPPIQWVKLHIDKRTWLADSYLNRLRQ